MKHQRHGRDNHFAPVHFGPCPLSGKVSFATRSDAKRVARHRDAGHLTVYRCSDHWHIGHLPTRAIAEGRACL